MVGGLKNTRKDAATFSRRDPSDLNADYPDQRVGPGGRRDRGHSLIFPALRSHGNRGHGNQKLRHDGDLFDHRAHEHPKSDTVGEQEEAWPQRPTVEGEAEEGGETEKGQCLQFGSAFAMKSEPAEPNLQKARASKTMMASRYVRDLGPVAKHTGHGQDENQEAGLAAAGAVDSVAVLFLRRSTGEQHQHHLPILHHQFLELHPDPIAESAKQSALRQNHQQHPAKLLERKHER